jgi:hypothetical protein
MCYREYLFISKRLWPGWLSHNGGVTYKESAKSFFALGAEDKLLGFFYIGHIAIPSAGTRRVPLEERMTWID